MFCPRVLMEQSYKIFSNVYTLATLAKVFLGVADGLPCGGGDSAPRVSAGRRFKPSVEPRPEGAGGRLAVRQRRSLGLGVQDSLYPRSDSSAPSR